MGGVLEITAQPPATWLPQTRVFDTALRALADELSGELAQRLDTVYERGTGYLDVRELEPERFLALTDAAGRAVAAELRRGPAEDSAVLRARYGLSLLHALLAADPRAPGLPGDDALPISDGDVWRAPAAAARLAREHLAAAAGGDPATLDVAAMTESEFDDVLAASEWMSARYAPGANLEADADAALATLHPPLAELAARLRADPRGSARTPQ